MKSSLGTQVRPRRRTGCHVRFHDVGNGEMLTTREIAERIGGTPHNVRARLAKGWTGVELLLPLRRRRKVGLPRVHTQVVAYKLAAEFQGKRPTVKRIIEIHPMSRSDAAYWRNAILIAQERTG